MSEYSPEIYNETFPKARKRHQCDICLRPINPGSVYTKFSGKWDGEFEYYTFHNRCYRLYNRLNESCDGELPFDDTIMYLSEHCQSNRQRRRKQQNPHEKA